jgi:hypothetical protein
MRKNKNTFSIIYSILFFKQKNLLMNSLLQPGFQHVLKHIKRRVTYCVTTELIVESSFM